MRVMKSAAMLNALIQVHINELAGEGYVWHSQVYRVVDGADGSNWNVKVNCRNDTGAGPVISSYLDMLRATYAIPDNDPTAIDQDSMEKLMSGR